MKTDCISTISPGWRARDPATVLLYGVQSLIDEHAGQHQQQHS